MNKVDKKRVADYFCRGIATYDQEAVVQKEVGKELISSIENIYQIRWNRVLEIGCCTGLMTEMLCNSRAISSLFLNDLVESCVDHTTSRIKANVKEVIPLYGDIEAVTLPDNLDLVISSSTFQWVDDLESCFRKVAGSLSAEGFFVFSMFGAGTMRQVRELLKVGLTYVNEAQLKKIIAKEFDIVELKSFEYTEHFQNPREVLRHIQKTGVGGVTEFRWTPAKLRDFEKRYAELYTTEKGIELSYNSINVIAEKR